MRVSMMMGIKRNAQHVKHLLVLQNKQKNRRKRQLLRKSKRYWIIRLNYVV
jgi:hypothetical protein